VSSESTILRLFGQVAKREGADCELHPLIHTFGSRLMPLDVMVGQKELDYESLRFFLRIPIEMVQTLHFQ
jgi:hypothetical protein